MNNAKKLFVVFFTQLAIYLLVYIVDPFIINFFNVGDSLFHKGLLFIFSDYFGGFISLIFVIVFTFLIMKIFVNELKYWFIGIPIYILFNLLCNTEDIYVNFYSLDKLKIDFAFVTIVIVQLLSWLVVKLLIKINKVKKYN